MAINFPVTLDDSSSLPNPAAGNNTNSPSHAGLHDNENAAIIAAETKLGTGSSVPATNTFLFGTGAGVSAWTAITSAQLAAALSDETGTGAAVFGTSPTLVTPKVDTINESTLSNGVTIGGLNIKSGALNTNNSVVTANITNASVTANKLATGAATATVATSQTTTSTSYADLGTVGPSVTVTVGANGLVLLSWAARLLNSGANYTAIGFAASGTNTIAAADTNVVASGSGVDITVGKTILLTGLSAGSTTFTLKYRVAGGTGTFIDRMLSAVPL